MSDLENKAFAVWVNSVPIEFKRTVIKSLYDLVSQNPNSNDHFLARSLKSVNANIDDSIFLDALASLKSMGVVATVKTQKSPDRFHVNIVKRKAGMWNKYIQTMG